MDTKTKEDILSVVSFIFCVVAICCISYFGVEKIQDAGKSYLNSMCEHRHVRMCFYPD